MSDITSSLKEGNIDLYPFYRHIKKQIPEIIEFNSHEQWRDYSSNIGNNKDLVVYFSFTNSFFIKGQAREKFFSTNIFSYFDNICKDIDKFFKAFNVILNYKMFNAFLEVDIKNKQLFFLADNLNLCNDKIIYLVTMDSNLLIDRTLYPNYKDQVIKDINNMIEPILNKTIKDIDDLSSSDKAILEILIL